MVYDINVCCYHQRHTSSFDTTGQTVRMRYLVLLLAVLSMPDTAHCQGSCDNFCKPAVDIVDNVCSLLPVKTAACPAIQTVWTVTCPKICTCVEQCASRSKQPPGVISTLLMEAAKAICDPKGELCMKTFCAITCIIPLLNSPALEIVESLLSGFVKGVSEFLPILLKAVPELTKTVTDLLSPVTGLLSPVTGLLSPVTGLLNYITGEENSGQALSNLITGVLSPVTGLLDSLTGAQNNVTSDSGSSGFIHGFLGIGSKTTKTPTSNTTPAASDKAGSTQPTPPRRVFLLS